MKIAILGTKGIPNNYGGFEQFAEYLSVRLVERGHDVTVYNPSFHPYRQEEFKGVRIIKIYSPEKWMGASANFIYDHLGLKHALQHDFDIIYEAGYHSVAWSYKILNICKYKRPLVLTNMDGIEWRRSKWNPWVRKLIRKLEVVAVRESPFLISDNPGIRQYYLDQFQRDSFFIPYGADAVYTFDPGYAEAKGVTSGNYFLLIARMEPENNIELILESYIIANPDSPFLVIGDYKNGYGRLMYKKYSSRVRFIGGVYNKSELDSLRHFSKAYFHGHSVGGTNPSLLEAMSCGCFILAHDNAFNRGVLGGEAIYFSGQQELVGHFKAMDTLLQRNEQFKSLNSEKIIKDYSWEKITSLHEDLFRSLLDQGR